MEKSFSAEPRHEAYVSHLLGSEDPDLIEIRSRSERAGLPQIHVAPSDARHLEVICRALAPRSVVEVGTLAGYSAVCLARGLAPDGKLYTFEFDAKHAQVARETFKSRGLDGKVRLYEGMAQSRLAEIENDGPFDLVFIDADKTGYPQYLEWATRHTRVGGVLIADNTLGWGLIDRDQFPDAATEQKIQALRKFNRDLFSSPHWRSTFLPTGEGLTLAVRI